MDHCTHRVVHGDELIDSGTPVETRTALGTGFVERGRRRWVCSEDSAFVLGSRVGHFRRIVEDPDQPLCQHPDQARRQQERLHTHVAQTRDRTRGSVRVKRRQYEMSGQTGLHGDLRGFQVSDLADHDDIGVLAEDGPESSCERHFDLGIDLSLADPVDEVFDRVLYRHDIAAVVVDPVERGVKGRGLA